MNPFDGVLRHLSNGCIRTGLLWRRLLGSIGRVVHGRQRLVQTVQLLLLFAEVVIEAVGPFAHPADVEPHVT